jgi:FkbM family methyltransferase
MAHVTSPPLSTVEFTLHGQDVALYLPDPTDLIQKKILQRNGFYEPTLLEAIRARVHRGELCVDVGAHLGNHTVFFAKICGMRVLAFEPQPDIYEILRRNVELNGVDEQVTTFNLALGEADGRGTLTRALPHNTGSARLRLDEAGSIRVATLDEHVGDRKVSLIKIDVEGFELEVLKGAERTIARDMPIICAEAAEEQNRQQLEAFLSPRGYVGVDQFAGTPVVVFVQHKTHEELLAGLALRFDRAQKARTEELRGRLATLSDDVNARLNAVAEDLRGRIAALSKPDGTLSRLFAALNGRSGALEQRLTHLETKVAGIDQGVDRLARSGREHSALLYELWNLGAHIQDQLARSSGRRPAPARPPYRPLNARAAELVAWVPRRKLWGVPRLQEAGDFLQGYTSKLSVHPGDDVDFHLSTDQTGMFAKIRVFGFGVFSRPSWDEVHCSAPVHVPATGVWNRKGPRVDEKRWQAVYSLQVGKTWPAGLYIVRFETVEGKATLHHLWVTSPAPAARIARLSSLMTHQARNRWGGVNPHRTVGRLPFGLARRLPFGIERRLPFGLDSRPPVVRLLRPFRGSRGSALLRPELSIQRWAGVNAAALDLLTDIDVHRAPELLDGYDHVVMAGDASYFTRPLTAALRAFRDRGGHLTVFGAAPAQFEVDLDVGSGTMTLHQHTPAEADEWRRANQDLWLVGQRWNHKDPPLDLHFLPPAPEDAGAARLDTASDQPGLCTGRLTGSTLDERDPALVATATDGTNRCDTILVETAQGGSLFVAGTDRWFAALDDNDRENMLPRELDLLTAKRLGVVTDKAQRDPLVSVVMTAYNSAAYISGAIESILSQSYANLELIIVDDSSADDTFQVALRYAEKDRRVRPFKSFQNHGTYWSKNFGMTRARGDFITFQDSDDLSDPDRLFAQLEPLRRNQRPIASVADYVRVSETGELLLNRGVTQRRAFPSLLIRTAAVLPRIGYFDSVRTSADQEYFHRLRLAFDPDQIIEIKRPLYKALARGGSLTQSSTSHVKLDAIDGANRDGLAHLSENRRQYVINYEAWHQRIERKEVAPFLPFPLGPRPFQVPADLDIAGGRKPGDVERAALVTEVPSATAVEEEIGRLAASGREIWHFVNCDGLGEVPVAGAALRTLRAFHPTRGAQAENAFTFAVEPLPGDDTEASRAGVAGRCIVGIQRADERSQRVEVVWPTRHSGPGHARGDYDIILMSDFRFPGGTSQSNAEEIKAQARLGLSTGLLQVSSPVLVRDHPINPVIQRCVDAGMARFVPAGAAPRARLLLVRHPTVFLRGKADIPPVEADKLVVIVNQPPVDAQTGKGWYSLAECQAKALACFGTVGTWFPIGPLVRRAIQGERGVTLAETDWYNILNLDDWRTPRSRFAADRPVIGRHSRDSADKWPDSREEILQAYPDDGEFRVRILGGGEYARSVLGGVLPDRWEVFKFGELAPRDFLASIDFFVYYHHPKWVEAFGRTILEAMGTGAPAILPPHFADLFQDAAIYAEPAEVRGIVRELYADRPRYEEWSRRAVELVESRFSYSAHTRRLEAMGCHADRSPAQAADAQQTGAPALRGPIAVTSRAAHVVELAAETVYKLDIDLEGLTERSRGLVRGVSSATGLTLFEVPIEGAKTAVGTFVVTRDKPEQIEVALSMVSDGNGRPVAAIRGVRFRRRAEPPRQRQLHLNDASVTAAMATYPGRRHILPAVMDTLLPQVERLFVYLNNYDDVPDFIRRHPQRERIVFILDPASQKRAAAKFYWLDMIQGFHLICDDDILYPPDYSVRMVEAIERTGRRGIVGVHGVLFKPIIEDARTSRLKLFKFADGLPVDTPVHFLGTGTVGLHADVLERMDVSRFQAYPIANDEILAVSAKNARVPMVCIGRPDHWLTPHPEVGFGIFEERSIDSDEHRKATELLASVNPWPEPGARGPLPGPPLESAG